MARKAKTGGTPATVALAAAGVECVLHPYQHGPGATYGEEAAAALGVEQDRIFKTLIAEVTDRLVVAVVPVAGQLDLKLLARALSAKRATMADPRAAERSSGYVLGGISPIGQRTALETVIDSSADDFRTVYVSAGRRGLQVELTPADLVLLTSATLAPISGSRAAA